MAGLNLNLRFVVNVPECTGLESLDVETAFKYRASRGVRKF